jgi:UDPglucose 6-dehydrogenase
MKKQKLAIIGLGKLGLNMAACLAYKGYDTIGVDNNTELIGKLKKGNTPLWEPGLSDLLVKAAPNFEVSANIAYAVRNSDIIFIFVGSPSLSDGSFSSEYAEVVAQEIGSALKEIDGYRLIVNRTTVMPGETISTIKNILVESSGKSVGDDFGMCFNPEFMALGSAIHNFLNPDVIAIGEYDERSGKMLEALYQDVCDNQPAIVRTSITNAEWSKLSLNVFLTLKLSYANAIAEVCEKIEDGNVDDISEILGHDPRIGRKFLSGAIGYGGPCFPRDTKAFNAFTNLVGVRSELSDAAEAVNDRQAEKVVQNVKDVIGPLKNKIISVLGVTYKPDTDIVDPSDQLKIVKGLLSAGARVRLTDPKGIANAKKAISSDVIEYFDNAEECIEGTDLCVLTTPWKNYTNLDSSVFVEKMSTPIVFDCWRALKNVQEDKRIIYHAVGINK